MAAQRLPMRKLREIVRMKSAGASLRAIAAACLISASTAFDYLTRIEAAGLGWPLPCCSREHPGALCTQLRHVGND
jgi:hypothetical protein